MRVAFDQLLVAVVLAVRWLVYSVTMLLVEAMAGIGTSENFPAC